MVAIYISKPAAKYFGIKRSKFDRFGEQTYALFYFAIFGAWGYVRVFLDCFSYPSKYIFKRIMTQLPTYWYNTNAFWVGECINISCFNIYLILFPLRLSYMAIETGIKALLLDANRLLVPTDVNTCFGN